MNVLKALGGGLACVVAGYVVLSLVGAVFIGALKDRARREYERRHGVGNVARQVKRIGVQIGQQLEVEYKLVPETKQYAPDVEVERVFAYNGAVRVEVTPMLRANVPSLLEDLADRCRKAEGIETGIPV